MRYVEFEKGVDVSLNFGRVFYSSAEKYLSNAREQLNIFHSIFQDAAPDLLARHCVSIDFDSSGIVKMSGVDSPIFIESRLINDHGGVCFSVLFSDESGFGATAVRRPLYLINLHTNGGWIDSSGLPLPFNELLDSYHATSAIEVVRRVLAAQLELNTERALELQIALPKIA